ncbi:MAG: FAD-dependent oxidoreductase [Verrucomicrobiota bacterium]
MGYHEGLLWFLQTDAEVPESLRQETAQYGFCKDEFMDHRNRPHYLYVRQGRRIVGEYNFTQRDADPDPATGLPPAKPDAVAVAVFAWDSHAVHKFDPAHPGVREGYFYVNHPALQLPYRIMVPKQINGLLVPVACSASHVGYQSIRVEPTFMALGEAAGIAAELAIRRQVEVRRVPIAELKQEILRRDGILVFLAEKRAAKPNKN